MADLYVEMNGNDTNDGTKNNPVATIKQAISLASNNDTINIGEGTFYIQRLTNLSKSSCTLNFKGKNEKTIVCVSTCNYDEYSGNSNIYNMIFKPTDNFSGETTAIVYSVDINTVKFHNCLFKKSDNGKYPTICYFYTDTSGTTNRNKYSYNCTFVGNLHVCTSGLVHLYYCANDCSDGFNKYENNIDSVVGCTYNSHYRLTNFDNRLYGVYSGDNPWKTYFILMQDGKFYSIKQDYYNSANKMYNEITNLTNDNFEDYGSDLLSLITDTTIDDETFKPIDKFDNFQLISLYEFDDLIITGLKSTQEMIATLEPLNMRKYATIHKITPNYTIDGNGSIKIAFSFDDGVTWKTWDATNDWTDLSNVEVPLKLYENFTDADKTAWSNAQTEINTNGIDITNLSTVTFPTDVKKMCFAIVFNRPTYADTATLTSFDILFDGLKTFIGLDRDKCAVKFTGDTITVTPTSSADQLLITMITGTN